MPKGKTILELMQEQEPLNNYEAADVCELYCNDGTMPCDSPCSWLELFAKRKFIDVEELNALKRKLYDNLMPDLSGKTQRGIEAAFASFLADKEKKEAATV